MQLWAGFFLAVVAALAAFGARSLSRSGALAAALLGTIIFGVGGWRWAALLLVFFITSSTLSLAFKTRKRGLNEKFSKGSQRDAGQVLGNGGLAALLAGLWFFFPGQAWVWAAFAASLAAVNADTWATELGVLNPHPPRLITSLRVVEEGASGAISPIGTLAALAGSALIGGLSANLAPLTVSPGLAIWVTLAGFLGALFDSFLGATAQAIYRCPACQKETEQHPLHRCGAPTTLIRGWGWLSNDLVNLACALSAAGLVLLLV